jgi:cytochrome c
MLMVAGASTAPLAFAQGELMDKSGCSGCHRVGEKLIGPAFQDVAARYRGDAKAADRLFDKVREGGSGAWGNTPMPPNDEERISDPELKAMIAWILSH